MIIIITSIVGQLSFFLITITIFAYGNGETTLLHLLRYPVLFISTILTISTFLIANRFDKGYSGNVFVDAEINQQG